MNSSLKQSWSIHDGRDYAGRWVDSIDLLLLLVVVVACYLLTYQPYYFGDELTPLKEANAHGWSGWLTYQALNTYKPRLIFNAIWALQAAYQWPRWGLLLPVLAGAFAVAAMLYYVARSFYRCSRGIALLVPAIFITSRFGVVTYYDYISATIEILSLAFFLGGTLLVLPMFERGEAPRLRRSMQAVLLFVAAVFVHERYAAASSALGIVMLGMAVRTRPAWAIEWKTALFGAAVLIVPVGSFAVANALCGSLPVSTGTAGKQVALSMGTVQAYGVFFTNAFFGLNFGQPWLSGSLKLGSYAGRYLLPCFAGLFGLIYVVLLARELRKHRANWRIVALLGAAILAFLFVASLPGPDREEARWIIPVACLVPLLFMSLANGWVRNALLALLLVSNVAYFALGSHREIVNVTGSAMAEAVASSLNTVRPTGKVGALINTPEPDTSWDLANNGAEEVFSRINLHGKVLLKSESKAGETYDFGLVFTGFDSMRRPRFAYLTKSAASALERPDDVREVEGQLYLGRGDNWSGWGLATGLLAGEGGLELRPGLDGHIGVPVENLDGAAIIYRAHSVDGPSPMRLQVNWINSKGRLINAFIKVVSVDKTSKNFAALLIAPEGAIQGEVYATLHDGGKSPVLLESVRLVPLR